MNVIVNALAAMIELVAPGRQGGIDSPILSPIELACFDYGSCVFALRSLGHLALYVDQDIYAVSL